MSVKTEHQILIRLEELQEEHNMILEWQEQAENRYNQDKAFFGKEEADNSEMLEASRTETLLRHKINLLKWVLNYNNNSENF
jgi:hypothetical protein